MSQGEGDAARRTSRCPAEVTENFLACTHSLDEIGAFFEFDSIGSGDKASGWHDYLGAYERLLLPMPLSASVLEIGVRAGSSLAMWSEYFPLGQVVGLDKSTDTFEKVRPVMQLNGAFSRGNVQVLEGNGTNISILDSMAKAGLPLEYNVVVDDANHWAKDQIARFEIFFPSAVKRGGIYIIEDVHIQAPYAHDGTAVREYFTKLSASAYLTEDEILVGAGNIAAFRNTSRDWRHMVESVTFLRDMVAISKAE